MFAQVREALSLWLRRRGVPFAAMWAREKLSGGQAEVEHAHLLFHLPDAWLKGAKLLSVNGGVQGGVKLLQLEAALCRIMKRCAGWLDHYAVKLKIPTDGGNPGRYNGRSYDGLYLLKGGGKQAWKLFRASSRNGASLKALSSANVVAALRSSVLQLVVVLATPATPIFASKHAI